MVLCSISIFPVRCRSTPILLFIGRWNETRLSPLSIQKWNRRTLCLSTRCYSRDYGSHLILSHQTNCRLKTLSGMLCCPMFYRDTKLRLTLSRQAVTTPKSEEILNVFDRKTKQTQRNRTSLLENYSVYDYLKEEVGWRMADRMSDIKRKFDVAVDLGCGRGHIGKNILSDTVGTFYQCDMSDMVLAQSAVSPEVPTYNVVADEEHFPFRNNSLDLVISSLSLHWVNDLPGTFKQVHAALKNDACFMGAMFGGDTLHELRVSLQLAELEREGGFAAHVSPFTSAQDLGSLLSRSGYVMLTIDVDEIIVNFPSMFELMHDLKGMGESNCAWSRRSMIKRDTLKAAGAIYKEKFGSKETDSVPAMFQILYFIGWKPDPSQRKVAERGSGEVSLKDIDKLDKVSKQVAQLKDDHGSLAGESTDRTIAELQQAIEKARRAEVEKPKESRHGDGKEEKKDK